MTIVFKKRNTEERNAFRDMICEQLVGNQDFIEDRIVVGDIGDDTVCVTMEPNLETDPFIKIEDGVPEWPFGVPTRVTPDDNVD